MIDSVHVEDCITNSCVIVRSSGDKSTEIRYVHILNKVLPAEIRVLAWCPVDVNFSARFA